jgi:microcystin-dependent protein
MPRNGSGTFVLAEPAFVPNTAISSAAVNSDFSDIADALTESLARDGQGGMTAVLPLANTGFTYLTDPNTGVRRTGADTQAIFGGGVDTVTVTSTGVSVTGTLAVSGVITSGGAALIPIGLGPLPWSGLTAPAKWLLCFGQTLVRATYPDLWAFISTEIAGGNTLFTNGNGTTTFTLPDMRGRIPVAADNMGGTQAFRINNILTNALGSVGGEQQHVLTAGEIPSITGVNSNTFAVSVQQNDGWSLVNNSASISSATGGGAQGAFVASNLIPPNAAKLITSSGNVSPSTVAFASNNTGGGTHINVQPSIVTNSIIYAGA